MSATLKLILLSLGFAGMFLIIGLLLRSKIKVLQKLYLPASVIGGAVGLLLIQLLGKIPSISEQVTNYKSVMDALPAILIIPIFASTPLGNFVHKDKSAVKLKKGPSIANGVFWIMCGMMAIQMVIGLAVNLIMSKTGSSIPFYKVWGFELAAGFVGGHGTAASVGAIYSTIDCMKDMASAGKDVATTFATFGLIGGMVLGIVFINIAARKGKLANIGSGVAEDSASNGLVRDVQAQESVGRQSTKNYALESISLIIAVIVSVVALSYGVSALLAKVPKVGSLLKQLPVWSIAMVIMILVNKLIMALKLEWLFDKKLVSRISGSMTDFAIVCAIASMNLKTIATYIVPILICSVLGFIATYLYIFKFTKFVVRDENTFEHSIIGWGTSTGVLMTGLVLLKVCDPDYKTPALNNFCNGFAIMSIVQAMILGVIMPIAIAKFETSGILVISLIMAAFFTAGAVVVGAIRNRKARA